MGMNIKHRSQEECGGSKEALTMVKIIPTAGVTHYESWNQYSERYNQKF